MRKWGVEMALPKSRPPPALNVKRFTMLLPTSGLVASSLSPTLYSADMMAVLKEHV